MYGLLNSNFLLNLFLIKSFHKLFAYFIISLAIALLIPVSANSHTNIISSRYSKNQADKIEELIAQANPGDGVIDEIFSVLHSYGVSVDYFYINGNCHGQDFSREIHPNFQSSDNFNPKFANSRLKQFSKFSVTNVAQTKQFKSDSVENAVQNVLRKNGFGGEVQVEGVYSNGQPCTFRLTQQQGCTYC
jgi:hypothetical protein